MMRAPIGCFLVGAAIALAACQPSQPAASSQSAAGAANAGAPALWSMDAQDQAGKTLKTVLICADTSIRNAFVRPLPSANGDPCTLVAPTVETGGRFAARCRSAGHLLDIQAETTGDVSRDFTVRLMIQTDVSATPQLVQTLHYRNVGACPSDWATGDAASPGDKQAVNSLSGKSHPLLAPAGVAS